MRLIIVGDTNIQNREEPASAFSRVRPLIDAADSRLGHAEGMFTEKAKDTSIPSLPYKERWRHSTPEMMQAYRDAGFDALSMASNVSADTEAVGETVSAAEANGLKICGIGRNLEEARKPAIVRHNGFSIALLSRTSVFWPNYVPATANSPGASTVRAYTAYQPGRRALEMPGAAPEVITWPDEDELRALVEDIGAAKENADLVLLSMHWGVSGSQEVYAYQRAIAHAACEAGASLVFGHHPHVVCPFEVYKNTPIFYSLGNFAFDWEKAQNRILDGIVLDTGIKAKDKSIDKVRVIPVRRGDDNLIAQLSAGDQHAIRTRDFLLETAIVDTSVAVDPEDNDVVVTITRSGTPKNG